MLSTAAQNSWGFIWPTGDIVVVAVCCSAFTWPLGRDIWSSLCSIAVTRWMVSSTWGPSPSLMSPSTCTTRAMQAWTFRSICRTFSPISCRPLMQSRSTSSNLPATWSKRAVIRDSISSNILVRRSQFGSADRFLSPAPSGSPSFCSALDMTTSGGGQQSMQCRQTNVNNARTTRKNVRAYTLCNWVAPPTQK